MPKIVFENSVFHPSIDPATHVLNVKQVGITPAFSTVTRNSLKNTLASNALKINHICRASISGSGT